MNRERKSFFRSAKQTATAFYLFYCRLFKETECWSGFVMANYDQLTEALVRLIYLRGTREPEDSFYFIFAGFNLKANPLRRCSLPLFFLHLVFNEVIIVFKLFVFIHSYKIFMQSKGKETCFNLHITGLK